VVKLNRLVINSLVEAAVLAKKQFSRHRLIILIFAGIMLRNLPQAW